MEEVGIEDEVDIELEIGMERLANDMASWQYAQKRAG